MIEAGADTMCKTRAIELMKVASNFAFAFLRIQLEQLAPTTIKCPVCAKRLGQRPALSCDDCNGASMFDFVFGVREKERLHRQGSWEANYSACPRKVLSRCAEKLCRRRRGCNGQVTLGLVATSFFACNKTSQGVV